MPDDSIMESPGLKLETQFLFGNKLTMTLSIPSTSRQLAAPRGKLDVTKLMKARLIKARLHLNSMHAQQEKSSRLAEVSSSSRLI